MRVKKRASKRLGTKQREKVKRKVREHHRKSRKEAKNDVTWKSKKRQDPGIPSSFPYKEQLLNEIEQRRNQVEQEKLAAKEARKNGNAEAEESEEGEETMDEDNEGTFEDAQASTSADVLPTSYTGSLKTFLSETLARDADPNVVLTILVLDARIPFKWRVEEVEKQIKKIGCPMIYAIARTDLVPREELCVYSAQLALEHAVFPVCSPAPAMNGIPARQGGGITTLVEYIEMQVAQAKKKKKSSKAPAVAIIGIENAGRTSLANILASSLPEVTILDTPGILLASSRIAHPDDVKAAEEQEAQEEKEKEDDEEEEEDEFYQRQRDRDAASRLLIRNAGSIFKVHEPLPLINELMDLIASKKNLMMIYNTPAFVDANDFLIGVARSSGHLKKGAIPDTIAAARTVLHQWSTGTVGYYSRAPSAITMTEDGTESHYDNLETIQNVIEHDESLAAICLPRKEWRKKWKGKELRLLPEGSGMLGFEPKLAFVKTEDEVEVAESEEDDEDVEFDDDEDEEDDDEDEEEDDEEDEEEDE
ncbi:uncharacterized protein FA14DRAFT_26412 [Meira miltonrushii]|uniref:Guanine nucleotide-binding protein-like 3 N-terminal domain-containing protein n=1 Tax=Meira miltonrushii TaxID=1280837 RepID=A0A316VL87_9BASI|nr:uncharacterized protein FA14DRAFT_26412 [Meira miltonrushii]PWN38389.1 hypothetical protein FA14DRAFT_26412 [Meira miltonrushii]